MVDLWKQLLDLWNSRSFYRKPEQNSWQSYYEENYDYEHNYRGLKRLAASIIIFLIVYAAQASDTRLGRETVNAVRTILSTQTDYVYWLNKARDYGSYYFPDAVNWSAIPIIEDVQATISKPADPLLYMSKPVEGKLTLKYGWYNDSVSQKDMFHEGIDISAPVGASVRAAAPGKVKLIEDTTQSGQLIILEHGQDIETVYGYLSEVLVKTGETVSQKQVIARVGKVKRSYQNNNTEPVENLEPLLYFEVRQEGKPIDPLSRIHEKFSEG